MQKYEHMVLTDGDPYNLEKSLNWAGEKGWRCVGAGVSGAFDTYSSDSYFAVMGQEVDPENARLDAKIDAKREREYAEKNE